MGSHGDSHGHGHAALATDIIPENSMQDKLLVAIAASVLISLLWFGFAWAFSCGAPAPEMPAESSEHGEH